MITLKENQSYAITLRFIKNKLQHYLNAVEQEIENLDMDYPQQWGEARVAEIKLHMEDLVGCTEALQAGMISVKNAVKYCIECKSKMDQTLTRYARNVLNREGKDKKSLEKLEPLVLAVVEFKRFAPETIIRENLSGREAKLEKLSYGIPSYSDIATILRVEDVAPKNLLVMVQRSLRKKAEIAKDEQRDFDFEKNYDLEGNKILEFSQNHIQTRLDLNNPDNHSFLKATLPRTNQKFMDRNHNKVEEQVKV
ncbi:MAG: hypothetical protein ACLTCN_07155 [Streptococcus salivarius]